MRGIATVMFNGALLLAFNLLLPVHTLKIAAARIDMVTTPSYLEIGFPVGSRSRLHISPQRVGWGISSKSAHDTVTTASKWFRKVCAWDIVSLLAPEDAKDCCIWADRQHEWVVDLQWERKCSIVVESVQETPGGFITTLKATGLKGAVTKHRVVVGKDQVRSFSGRAEREVAVEELVTYTIKYMMDKGMSLDNTEGMIDASVFPVNYFTLRQLTYFHDDVDEKITALCKEAPELSEW